MFRPLTAWLISLRDSVVADQAAEIKGWEERGAAFVSKVDELKKGNESAESTAEDLRREIRDLQRQLETEQRAHEATRHEKKCTEAENRLLATIHEVDVQRRQTEKSVLCRQQAEAEAGLKDIQAEE